MGIFGVLQETGACRLCSPHPCTRLTLPATRRHIHLPLLTCPSHAAPAIQIEADLFFRHLRQLLTHELSAVMRCLDDGQLR